MGQVHEIVDEELIIAFDLRGAPLENPLWIRAPGKLRNPGFIGEFGSADPNPNEPMPLHDGIDADSRISVNARLTGHPDTLPARIEFKSVVLADEMIFLEIALRKGQEAVRATILEGTESAICLAIENQGFATNDAGKWGMFDFVIPGNGVPEVTQEHGGLPQDSLVSYSET
jgi:hypothetical protein